MWVFYSARPLYINELLEAVQMGEYTGRPENFPRYEEEAVIEACANLIEVNNGFMRPIHQSVKEYFTTQPESAIQESCKEFFVDSTTAHTVLSRTCLSYLLQGFLDDGPCKEDYTLYCRLQTYELASYSSYFFDSHLRQLSEIPKEPRELLKRFLSSSCTAFAAVMQLRTLSGCRSNLFAISTQFTAMSQKADAFTIIHSTGLVDHPGLRDDIEGFLLTSSPKYIIHQVAGAGLLDYTAKLIQEGYQVDERDSQNKTPLHHASKNGHREICCYLLKHGANAAAKADNGMTALHKAASGGHEAVVQLLLEDYKANIEAKTDDGMTPLHLAAAGGNEAVVRLLLKDYKADVAAETNRGKTALHMAADGGHEEVVQILKSAEQARKCSQSPHTSP